jgi:hypothetical protein
MFYPVPRADRSERQSVVAFICIIAGSVGLTVLLSALIG